MLKYQPEPLEKRVYLSSPTMHGEEMHYMREAYDTNWMSTVGENINEVERLAAAQLGCGYAVALGSGTAALHLCMKLAGIGAGTKVACSTLTFAATANPICYEGGSPVFIDSERESWNMDPAALRLAFEKYPDIKAVVCADLYGTPAKLSEIAEIAAEHNAVFIEDAAEALGAYYAGKPCGSFGVLNAISFNGNKMITGSSGGVLASNDESAVGLARKWSTQSRENAPWYQHTCLGYNYRMSNVVAGVVRGQWPHLREHIEQKQAIYERYREGFKNLPVTMNPLGGENAVANNWLSCILINAEAMCPQTRTDCEATFTPQPGKSCPTEILNAISSINAEGRPVWKPMHLQPVFTGAAFVSATDTADADVSADLFTRGLCLPSDNKMTPKEQDRIIETVKACFG